MERLPLPVTCEHVLRPLLLRLPARPDVALALIRLGPALGSAAASAHLVPPLLAVLSTRPPQSEAAAANASPRSRRGELTVERL